MLDSKDVKPAAARSREDKEIELMRALEECKSMGYVATATNEIVLIMVESKLVNHHLVRAINGRYRNVLKPTKKGLDLLEFLKQKYERI